MSEAEGHGGLPLAGVVVLEFSQYLAGPYAGLRLADLGARVIKVERPGSGDACRQLATKNMRLDGDSVVFHTINRNKESITANLKDPADRERIHQLITRADVMTHNFRPGVIEKIGLDWDSVCKINPRIVYGEVTGYGREGPWRDKPGQDLLAQARSGLMHLTGNAADDPTPCGLAVIDMICGTHLAQGLLAALALPPSRRGATRVQVSLLESALDLQFEVLTTHWADDQRLPQRAVSGNAHAYTAAPYGIYRTADGYLSLAMVDLADLAGILSEPCLAAFTGLEKFSRRDEIMAIIAARIQSSTTADWIERLEAKGLWGAEVLDYPALLDHPAYQVLRMDQVVRRGEPCALRTTRCPVRVDGQRIFSPRAAPFLGADNGAVDRDLMARSILSGEVERSGLPLTGLTVVDFSQFLSGPSASLRLADLGARVIKIERPEGGDICRSLYTSAVEVEGDSTIFHAINRHKESYAADLKNADHVAKVKRLIARADVVLHNFRPGVMDRLGLGYEAVHAINPRVIYAGISGYGEGGPWRDKAGQDLLLQARSGLTWFSGNAKAGPVPMGVALVDVFAGAQLTHGILACLVRRHRTGRGGRVDVSMLETALDLQIEPLTLYWQDGGEPVERTCTNNAHPLVAAPYGVYATGDGFLALAMGSIPQLGELLECPALLAYLDPSSWFAQRDEIKRILAEHLRTRSTEAWLGVLEPADIWCAPVLDYVSLRAHPGYEVLGMEQLVNTVGGAQLRTTRCPITWNGRRLISDQGAPRVGQHTAEIDAEFRLP